MGRNDQKFLTTRKLTDLNNERITYAMTCLMGQAVTVCTKEKTQFRGIFFSYDTGGWNKGEKREADITLSCARQIATQNSISSEIVNTLIIPGDDYVTIAAEDVPLDIVGATRKPQQSAFQTDAEISSKRTPLGQERELERWVEEPTEGKDENLLLFPEQDGHTGWDQFELNQRRFGVETTYDDNLYTTKLDMESIPNHVQEKAHKIAKELEGVTYERAHVDPDNPSRSDLCGDEEALYSAVGGTGHYDNHSANDVPISAGSNEKQKSDAPPSNPPGGGIGNRGSEEGLEASTVEPDKSNRKGKGGGANKSAANSELKEINALNLEPAIATLDERTRREWANSRPTQKSSMGIDTTNTDRRSEKQQLMQEMEVIKDKMHRIGLKTADSENRNAGGRSTGSTTVGSGQMSSLLAGALQSAATSLELSGDNSQAAMQMGQGPIISALNLPSKNAPASADSATPKTGSKKEFQFNPNANAFTPGGPRSSEAGHDNTVMSPAHTGGGMEMESPPLPHTRHSNGNAGMAPSPHGMNERHGPMHGSMSQPVAAYHPGAMFPGNSPIFDVNHRFLQPFPPTANPGGPPARAAPPQTPTPQKHIVFAPFTHNPRNKRVKFGEQLLSQCARIKQEDAAKASHEWEGVSNYSYKQVIGDTSPITSAPAAHLGFNTMVKSGHQMPHTSGHLVAYGFPQNMFANPGNMGGSGVPPGPAQHLPFQVAFPSFLQMPQGPVPNQGVPIYYQTNSVPDQTSPVRPAPNPHVQLPSGPPSNIQTLHSQGSTTSPSQRSSGAYHQFHPASIQQGSSVLRQQKIGGAQNMNGQHYQPYQPMLNSGHNTYVHNGHGTTHGGPHGMNQTHAHTLCGQSPPAPEEVFGEMQHVHGLQPPLPPQHTLVDQRGGPMQHGGHQAHMLSSEQKQFQISNHQSTREQSPPYHHHPQVMSPQHNNNPHNVIQPHNGPQQINNINQLNNHPHQPTAPPQHQTFNEHIDKSA